MGKSSSKSKNNDEADYANSTFDNHKEIESQEKSHCLNINLIKQLKEELLNQNKHEELLKDEICCLHTIQVEKLNQINNDTALFEEKHQIHLSV